MTDTPHDSATAPAYVRRAWALRRDDTRNRGLTLHKVVRAAVAVADAHGLARVTIRTLSQRLGFTPMAVYRHVASREELLVLMCDVALAAPPDAVHDTASWQHALRTWGRALFARYLAHPWLLDVPIYGLPTTPNHIAWVERILAGLASTGWAVQRQLDAALLVDGHARHTATLALAGTRARSSAAPMPSSRWIASWIDPETHPYFSRVLREGILGDDVSGPDFDAGLTVIIAGLEVSPSS